VKYSILDIPQGFTGGLNQSFSESAEGLGFLAGEVCIQGQVNGNFRLWRDRRIVTIQGGMTADVSLQCCRCLAVVVMSLQPILTLRCFPEEAQPDTVSETGEVTPEDDTYMYEGIFLDIRPIIREQVILSVPAYVYCREDCSGLCDVCGQDLNGAKCGCVLDQPSSHFLALQRLKQTLG
tara:strand:- start:1147 stop:1683 length:537 start_codon:yes stop_codon:yes gene_type:complete